MSSIITSERRAAAASVIIVGNDTGIAARPASPVQFAHACLSAGYHAVVPESWGDELVAAACIRRLAARPSGPAIFCDCPCVAHRLLATGSDLGRFFISLVAPPVAAARYVRALYAPHDVRITYVGRCPGAVDDAIDARFTPAAFLATLAERDIDPLAQPEVFDSVLPPDRRRHHSLPGGLPAPEALRAAGLDYRITELQGDAFTLDLAQVLLSAEPTLVDLGPREGCYCAGAVTPELRQLPDDARALIASTEPPRSPSPVVDETIPIELEFPLPAAARGPVELSLSGAVPHEPEAPPRRRSPAGGIVRPVTGVSPVTRSGEGRVLPRAYLARRRSPPGIPRIADEATRETTVETMPAAPREGPREAGQAVPREAPREVAREVPRAVEPRSANHSPMPSTPLAPAPHELPHELPRQLPHQLPREAPHAMPSEGPRATAPRAPAIRRPPEAFSLQHVILIALIAAAIVLLSVIIGLATGRWLAHVTTHTAPATATASRGRAIDQPERELSAGGRVRLTRTLG